MLVKEAVISSCVKCHFYVYLADSVFEGGGIELYGNVHVPSILYYLLKRNHKCVTMPILTDEEAAVLGMVRERIAAEQ